MIREEDWGPVIVPALWPHALVGIDFEGLKFELDPEVLIDLHGVLAEASLRHLSETGCEGRSAFGHPYVVPIGDHEDYHLFQVWVLLTSPDELVVVRVALHEDELLEWYRLYEMWELGQKPSSTEPYSSHLRGISDVSRTPLRASDG